MTLLEQIAEKFNCTIESITPMESVTEETDGENGLVVKVLESAMENAQDEANQLLKLSDGWAVVGERHIAITDDETNVSIYATDELSEYYDVGDDDYEDDDVDESQQSKVKNLVGFKNNIVKYINVKYFQNHVIKVVIEPSPQGGAFDMSVLFNARTGKGKFDFHSVFVSTVMFAGINGNVYELVDGTDVIMKPSKSLKWKSRTATESKQFEWPSHGGHREVLQPLALRKQLMRVKYPTGQMHWKDAKKAVVKYIKDVMKIITVHNKMVLQKLKNTNEGDTMNGIDENVFEKWSQVTNKTHAEKIILTVAKTLGNVPKNVISVQGDRMVVVPRAEWNNVGRLVKKLGGKNLSIRGMLPITGQAYQRVVSKKDGSEAYIGIAGGSHPLKENNEGDTMNGINESRVSAKEKMVIQMFLDKSNSSEFGTGGGIEYDGKTKTLAGGNYGLSQPRAYWKGSEIRIGPSSSRQDDIRISAIEKAAKSRGIKYSDYGLTRPRNEGDIMESIQTIIKDDVLPHIDNQVEALNLATEFDEANEAGDTNKALAVAMELAELSGNEDAISALNERRAKRMSAATHRKMMQSRKTQTSAEKAKNRKAKIARRKPSAKLAAAKYRKRTTANRPRRESYDMPSEILDMLEETGLMPEFSDDWKRLEGDNTTISLAADVVEELTGIRFVHEDNAIELPADTMDAVMAYLEGSLSEDGLEEMSKKFNPFKTKLGKLELKRFVGGDAIKSTTGREENEDDFDDSDFDDDFDDDDFDDDDDYEEGGEGDTSDPFLNEAKAITEK